MKKSTIVLTMLLLSTSAMYAEGPNEYEINYGPNNQKLTLKKSNKFIGVKPTIDIADKELDTFLGAEEATKVNRLSVLGGFQTLQAKEGETIPDAELDHIRSLSTIGIGTHVYHTQEDDDTPLIPTGDLYIKFVDNATEEECTQILESHYLNMIDVRGKREFIVQVTKNSHNPVKTAFNLQKNKAVVTAEPDFATPIVRRGLTLPAADKATLTAEPDLATPIVRSGFTLPADALLKDQWHLENTGVYRGSDVGIKAGADARVVEAWKTMGNMGSSNVIVAIMDDGFDYIKHKDLSGANKIVTPYDFVNNTLDPQPDAFGWNYHGTACAGVAVGNAGVGNQSDVDMRYFGGGIIGAAPNARLMPLRIKSYYTDQDLEIWFWSAATLGADIISCSLGDESNFVPISTRAWNAIHHAATTGRNGKGSIIVFAAGDRSINIKDLTGRVSGGFAVHPDESDVVASTSTDQKAGYGAKNRYNPILNPRAFDPRGTLNGFAIHPDVIAVSASTSIDTRAYYSNFGKEISVCAPSSGLTSEWGGEELGITTADVTDIIIRSQLTARPPFVLPRGHDMGPYTSDFGGTSSAAALVSGISALVLSVNPGLTAIQVKDILQKTARKIGNPASYDANNHSIFFGYGCVDANAAVLEAKHTL